jgi:two-component system NtrC family sensor kinase
MVTPARRSSLGTRLVRSFSLAILIPCSITAVAGGLMLRDQVYAQAQVQVMSDIEAASELFRLDRERIRDTLRVHALRAALVAPIEAGDDAALLGELDRLRREERLDFLDVLDVRGVVRMRATNPGSRGDDRSAEPLVAAVLSSRGAMAGLAVLDAERLALESPDLAARARMDIQDTPMAASDGKRVETSGMIAGAASPLLTRDGRIVGVLYGGVLLNRSTDLVDRIRATVFRDEGSRRRGRGYVTLFLGDVRIATNVLDESGQRAIATRAQAEPAARVLGEGSIWYGRAFVVNDWHIAAYRPLRDAAGRIAGMLYVGTPEQPYRDALAGSLAVFLGIAGLGIALVWVVAFLVARRIVRPLYQLAWTAQKAGEGDFGYKVPPRGAREIVHLTDSFNRMTTELARTHAELRELAQDLERKVVERTNELEAARESLLHSERLAAIGRLAAGVAHEINNPLTGILGNSSLLLEDMKPDDPLRPDIQIIVDETLRCRRIVKGLLDFARQTPFRPARIAVDRVVEDVLGFTRNLDVFRAVRFEVALDPSAPEVFADFDQLRQVFVNLLVNAAEAMSGSGVVRISSRFDAGRRALEVTIADSGPGIPAPVRERAFEPFFTTKPTGTGLGLAIAYGILERHGGTIRIADPASGGAELTLVLPVDEPAAPAGTG